MTDTDLLMPRWQATVRDGHEPPLQIKDKQAAA